jgi:hypothetical protein
MTSAASVRDWALRALVIGVVCIALAYASAFLPAPLSQAGPWLMAVMMPVTMFAMMILGAVRDVRGLGPLAVPFVLVLALVAGGFLIALALPPERVDTPLLLGLPRRAAVILFGVGLLPLFVLPIVYALTFDKLTLTDDDIARVRAARLPETKSIGAREGTH